MEGVVDVAANGLDVADRFSAGMTAMARAARICEEAPRCEGVTVVMAGVEVEGGQIVARIGLARGPHRYAVVRVWGDEVEVADARGPECRLAPGHPSAAAVLDLVERGWAQAAPPTDHLTPAQVREVFVAGLGRSRPDGLT